MREERSSSSSSRLGKVAKKMILVAVRACGSFSRKKALVDPIPFDHSNYSASISGSCGVSPKKPRNNGYYEEEDGDDENDVGVGVGVGGGFESSCVGMGAITLPSTKSLCAICLDPLNYGKSQSKSRSRTGGQAIFTAQCSHAFHFSCIASNVRHGSVTCPICRAHWTQLPRNLHQPPAPATATADPILRILDDSIATFRVHRRSFLRSALYDDDDPLDHHHSGHPPDHRHRLRLSLSPQSTSSSYLSVGLAGPHRAGTDLVLVASPNGPHLRLLKQCMALAVFSLRPVDRLAIVTYSSAAARVFPLRRMTACGKRAAMQVIDRLFYMGQADPVEGLKKGVKILRDRAHRNPESAILHLSDTPVARAVVEEEIGVPVHRFHVGFGTSTSNNNGNNNGFVMHEFGEFLAGMLGGVGDGVIKDLQLRVRAEGEERVVRIGELRGGEERRVLLELGESGHAFVEYSYCDEDFENDGDGDERFVRGESLVSVGDGKSGEADGAAAGGIGGGGGGGGRLSGLEGWDYHDPYMARRWAKHLHGYRL